MNNRRKSPRIYFNDDERLNAEIVTRGEAPRSYIVPVLDLGLGGLHFSAPAETHCTVGDKLSLTRLEGSKLCIESIAEIEVCWVVNNPEYKRIYLGCKFTELPSSFEQAIAELIRTTLSQSTEES
ncbi:MAG: hypothetical protein CSA34_06740 [Desulfobulbus propionicus]|nr:MAG: hypothetical protein CSA34_06740 [Desulfobulbus propionicus]